MIMLNYTVNNHPSFILHLKLCIYNHISALLRKKKEKKKNCSSYMAKKIFYK